MNLAVLISRYSFVIAIVFIFAFLFYHFFYKPRMDRLARENPNQPKNQFHQVIEDFRNSDFVKGMQEAQEQIAEEKKPEKKIATSSKKENVKASYNPYATDFGSMGGDLGL